MLIISEPMINVLKETQVYKFSPSPWLPQGCAFYQKKGGNYCGPFVFADTVLFVQG